MTVDYLFSHTGPRHVPSFEMFFFLESIKGIHKSSRSYVATTSPVFPPNTNRRSRHHRAYMLASFCKILLLHQHKTLITPRSFSLSPHDSKRRATARDEPPCCSFYCSVAEYIRFHVPSSQRAAYRASPPPPSRLGPKRKVCC